MFGTDALGNLASMPLKALRTPGVFNLDPAKLLKWRRALARQKAALGQAKLAIVGDSTTAGAYSGPTGNSLRSGAWPTILAADLVAAGRPASADSVWGDAGVAFGSLSAVGTAGSAAFAAYDPRVTFQNSGTVHANSSGTMSLGGSMFYNYATTGTFMTFAPVGAVDAFDVYYATGPSFGSFTASIDGMAASAAVSTAVASGVSKATFAASALGVHTLALAATSTANVYIIGIHGYSTTSPKISILNMGWSSAESTDWATNGTAYNPLSALAYTSPDLTLICLDINDWAKGVTPATHLTNYQALAAQAKLTGDVALVVGFPSNPASTSYPLATAATQAAIVAQDYALAASLDCPLVDLTYRFGGWASANALGEAYNDLHPNNLGYPDIASAMRPLFFV
ncbi:MAG: SGNH/GDSL hydrolase family protein [Caulobacteraceae bacterium]